MNDVTGKIRADGRTSGPMRSLIEALTSQRKRQLAIVGLLMLVSGLAELVTIGSLIPFLALLSGSASIDWPIVSALLEGIGRLDPERGLVTALLL